VNFINVKINIYTALCEKIHKIFHAAIFVYIQTVTVTVNCMLYHNSNNSN